jgi:hypothetical protein
MTVFAFDRANRWYDADGRLRVALTNISKANICPYYGREIPDFEALGLDSETVYQLYRDPEELARAAETFNNVPLLLRHVPVSASDHQPELIAGTVSNVAFSAPYLQGSLAVWSDEAIDLIESEKLREISSSYRYRAEMTPGEIDGVKYDGVMRDLEANHVALVESGRAGPDVLVADSIPKDMKHMALLTRKAALVKGALTAYLKPKMAADAAIPDLSTMLKGVGQKNWATSKPKVIAALKRATTGKLAADADIGDVVELLDTLGETSEEVADVVEAQEAEKPALDADPVDMEKLLAFLADKLSPEDLAALKTMVGETPAADADPEADPKDKPVPITKAAMDAALADVRAKARADARAMRDAERAVEPIVGQLAVAMDGADEVYRFGLKQAGIDVAGVHPSAFPVLVKQYVAGQAKRQTIAQDSVPDAGYADRWGRKTIPVKHQ